MSHKRLLFAGFSLWTALIVASLVWNFLGIEKAVMEIAYRQLQAAFEKEVSLRFWAASVGGVYVSMEKVHPNPYLAFLPNRDVTTDKGQRLTLVNPAYMTRLIYESSKNLSGIKAHLISLNPINPINRPDKVEAEALKALKKGKNEVFVIDKDADSKTIKLIKPLFVRKPCLKCHKAQGYKIGDIRGGISISAPFRFYASIISSRQTNMALIHTLICLIGYGLLFWSYKFITRTHETIVLERERLKTLMDAMPDIVCFKDGQGRWLEANKFDLELFGLEHVDYRGKKDSELAKYSEFYTDAFLKCEETDEIAWKNRGPTRSQEIIPLKNGEYKVLDVIKVPLFHDDGSRKGLVIVGRDITEQAKAQKQLEKASRLKELILNLAIDFINIPLVDLNHHINTSLKTVGEFLEADRAYLMMTDHNKANLVMTNEWCAKDIESRFNAVNKISKDELEGLFDAQDENRGIAILDQATAQKNKAVQEFFECCGVKSAVLVRVKDDNECLGVVCLENIREKRQWSEEYVMVLRLLAAIYANAIRRSHITRQLKESEQKYRELFERIPTGLYQNTPGPEGRFIMVNKALVEMFGYDSAEEMLKVPVASLYPNSAQRLEFSNRLMKEGMVKDFELQLKRRDGTLFWASITATAIKDINGNTIYFEGAVLDISERKEAEKEKMKLQLQLQQSQKLESIGRLAGGVAHDLNNLLLPIIGYTELLLNRIDEKAQEFQYAQRIGQAAERAKEIVGQLLAFSRKNVFDLAPVDINKVLEEFSKLLRHTIKENIEINLKLTPNLPTIKADKGKIEQVILNMAVNAQDAMPKGGTLTIETFYVELDEKYAASHRGVVPGPYVCLSISDTGHGMDEETMKYIFEPFFTTKSKETGTGLGLATVYGIIKQHRGNIWVYSEVGKGTTFKIYLPVSGEAEPEKIEDTQISEDLFGTETIMVVEDNKEARRLVVYFLADHGYHVLEASSPDEALKMASSYSGSIDLLLTDVIMPGKNGRELYEEMLKIFPNLKVVYMSGYTENVISDQGVLKDGINFISKPFNSLELLKKIRQALNLTS